MLVSDIIEHHARYRRSHTALIWSDGKWTYGEFGDAVARCANLLLNRGIRPGDRVAVLTENTPWFLVLLFATARVGGIFVPLNYRLAASELIDNIDDAKVSIVIAQLNHLERLLDAAPKPLAFDTLSLQPTDRSPNLPQALAGLPTVVEPVAVTGDDPVLLQYTSGTTGKPKGVLSKHSAWGQSCALQAPLKRMTLESRFLGVLPMCYTGGLKASLEIIFAGGTMVICSHFDADEVLDKIEKFEITNIFLVPTMFYSLLDTQAAHPRNLTSLRWVNCGGAPLIEARVHQAFEMFDCHLTQGYGMTEMAGGSITFAAAEDAILNGVISPKLNSVGKPLIDCTVKLVDDDGNEVPVGTPGEVLVKSDRTLVGYWGKPASETPTDAEGFYHTGDVAQFDEDGYLYIVDRKKDMIISGGLNIYSKEVEDALNSHEAVQEAYVVGLPDEKWGERVHAFVVLKPGAATEEDNLQQWCKQLLGSYKCPRSFTFVARETLPVNWGGKVQKRTLKENYLNGAIDKISGIGA